jgi:chromate reductase
MAEKMKVLVIGGSLRQEAFTKVIIRAVMEICPEDMEIMFFEDLAKIPNFNQDLENALPEIVQNFKQRIKEAAALLFVTPEYNYSLPGYLKNAIDWASRPYGDNSFNDKPAAIMSSSTGMLGGARAQYVLRQSGVFLNIHFLNQPEIMIPNIADKIVAGKLTDEHTRQKIKEQLLALREWTKRLA